MSRDAGIRAAMRLTERSAMAWVVLRREQPINVCVRDVLALLQLYDSVVQEPLPTVLVSLQQDVHVGVVVVHAHNHFGPHDIAVVGDLIHLMVDEHGVSARSDLGKTVSDDGELWQLVSQLVFDGPSVESDVRATGLHLVEPLDERLAGDCVVGDGGRARGALARPIGLVARGHAERDACRASRGDSQRSERLIPHGLDACLSVKSTVAEMGVIPSGQPGPYRVPSPVPSRVAGLH